MADRNIVPTVLRGPVSKRRGQTGVDCASDPRDVDVRYENLQSRSPAVVGGTFRVEPEHVRAKAEQPGRMPHIHEGPDDLVVERSGEFEPGSEAGHDTDRRVRARTRKTAAQTMIQSAIQQLLDGRDLGRAAAREVMGEIMSGEATPAQIGGFLVALRAKGESVEEIAGCAEAMHEHVLQIHPTREDVVDVVGTGGDGAATFNISTTAAIVAASGGAGVAKHGNRAVSSVSGSADVLEALGFELEQPPERIAQSIDELGFGFMFAPVHHPAMRHAAPVRRELGTRTIFNVLGPLTNPAGARGGIFGVYSPELVRTIADVLVTLGSRRAYVVHGAFGIDELSPAGPNAVCEVFDGKVRERTIDPLELGIERCDPEELVGGSPEENARTARDVLAGARGGERDAVLLNAAGAIAASGHAADLREGLTRAADEIDSGRAGERLEELMRFSQGESP